MAQRFDPAVRSLRFSAEQTVHRPRTAARSMPRLKILFAVSECVPFAKTGGLGDVAGALPMALAARGHDVRVVIPRYRSATALPAERLGAPLGVPIGYGDAWGAVWESRLPPGSTNTVPEAAP